MDSASVEPKRRDGERRRIATRLASAAVAIVMAAGSLTANAAPGSSTAVSDGAKLLNTRAHEQYEAGDLIASAGTYAEILGELSENNVNREERDNVILLHIAVTIEAYEKQNAAGDDKAIALLERAVVEFDNYEAVYKRTYGGTSISAEAAQAGRELKSLLEQAQRKAPPPPEPKREEPPPVIFNPNQVDYAGPNGTGLIVSGSIFLAAGLGTTAMIIIGAQMTKQANRDKDDAMTEEQADAIDRRGSTGNALIISGAILTAAFIISGATMLGIGIHRRQRYMAFTPTVGRGYAGIGLRGRF